MTISRRHFTALTGAAAITLGAGISPAQAKIVSTEEAMTELVFGKPDAPVEIIEYASLACPACKHFHENIWPTIKKDYIDTGKVRFIYRDFPTNSAALAAAMIARCAGPERHGGLVDIFFQTQGQWGRSENPLRALGTVARMAGLGANEVDECLRNSDLMNGIQNSARKASEEKGVRATPTVFINGELALNSMDLYGLIDEIDAALK